MTFSQGSGFKHMCSLLSAWKGSSLSGSAAIHGHDVALEEWTEHRMACVDLILHIIGAVVGVSLDASPSTAGELCGSLRIDVASSLTSMVDCPKELLDALVCVAVVHPRADSGTRVKASAGTLPPRVTSCCRLAVLLLLFLLLSLLSLLLLLLWWRRQMLTFSHYTSLAQAFRVLAGLLFRSPRTQATFSQLCCTVPSSLVAASHAVATSVASQRLIPATSLVVMHSLFCGADSTRLPAPLHVVPCGEADAAAQSAAARDVVLACVSANKSMQTSLVSFAIAPPPAFALGLPEDSPTPTPPSQIIVNALASTAAVYATGTGASAGGGSARASASVHGHASDGGGHSVVSTSDIVLFRACRLLRALLHDDSVCKEVALRIVVSTGGAGSGATAAAGAGAGTGTTRGPPSLFSFLSSVFHSTLLQHLARAPPSPLVVTAVGRLLAEWLSDCPAAVRVFLPDGMSMYPFDVAATAFDAAGAFVSLGDILCPLCVSCASVRCRVPVIVACACCHRNGLSVMCYHASPVAAVSRGVQRRPGVVRSVCQATRSGWRRGSSACAATRWWTSRATAARAPRRASRRTPRSFALTAHSS
jgi:hypothetical protein